MAAPVLEVSVDGHPYVFARNERGEYEFVFGTLRILLYPEGHVWGATIMFQANDPSCAWKEAGYGRNAETALQDAVQATAHTVRVMHNQVMDFQDFLRGVR